MRRSKRQLEQAITSAGTKRQRAMAWYQLGLFHDNNSREAAAIPRYEQALRLGLDARTKVQALAWLASSLMKTGPAG